MKQVLLYLPVIHAGYERFLQRHADTAEILLLGEGFIRAYHGLAHEERALPPRRAADYLRRSAGTTQVRVIEPPDLESAITADVLALPDEEVTRDLVSRYNLDRARSVLFDRTFLRWNRPWAITPTPVSLHDEVSVSDLHRELLGIAKAISDRSSDWWRQVGALAARGRQVLGYAWNRHHPSEYSPYFDGDPRDDFERGVRVDLSTAIHAEAALIARAAREGVLLDGADIYTTTFPCPACARLIAVAGFRRCFFADQYSVPDGGQVLRAAGVRLIKIDAPAPKSGLPATTPGRTTP